MCRGDRPAGRAWPYCPNFALSSSGPFRLAVVNVAPKHVSADSTCTVTGSPSVEPPGGANTVVARPLAATPPVPAFFTLAVSWVSLPSRPVRLRYLTPLLLVDQHAFVPQAVAAHAGSMAMSSGLPATVW